MPLPLNFFFDSYDLKSMSFKVDNDIFITFEMPIFFFFDNDILENHISLLFRPSLIRGRCLDLFR